MEYSKESILLFIRQFRTFSSMCEEDTQCEATMWYVFRNGYCWHFAHMLKDTFGCGEVCWAAPFGHFVWLYNSDVYDIEGEYRGEASYFIPESYIPNELFADFKHIPGLKGKTGGETSEDIENIIRRYCEENGMIFDDEALHYLEPIQKEES